MKKILLILLLLITFIPRVNAETVKVYLIKDGIEQTDFTGGSVYHNIGAGDANEQGSLIEGEGYIDLSAKVWAQYLLTFNNNFDFTKYTILGIDFEYSKTSTPYATNNSGLDIWLRTSNFIQNVKTSKTMPRTTTIVDLSSGLESEQLAISVRNSGDGVNYTNYPFRIYNIWFEYEKVEEPEVPVIPDTTLDSFYTIYIDKLKILADYSLENKFILVSIAIILLFTILELILYLFNKGGYRR